MKAYSADLRQKIVAAYQQGEGTMDEIADLFSIARRTLASYVKFHRSGESLQPKPHGGGVPFSLTDNHLTVLQARIAEKNDLTLDELVAYLKEKQKVTVHRSTVRSSLAKIESAAQKKSLAAAERNQRAREWYRQLNDVSVLQL